MNTMDFGIPDLSNGRDAAPDATRRRGKTDTSDFSAMLGRAVGEQDEPPRDEATDQANAAAKADTTRDKSRRPDRAERTDRPDKDQPPRDKDDNEPAQTAADTPASPQEPAKQTQPAHEKADAPQTAAQTGEHPNADAATPSPEQAAEELAAAQQASASAQPTLPTDPAKAAGNAPAAQHATPTAATPPTPPVADPTASAAAETAKDSAKKPDPTASASVPFSEQLAAATPKPAEPTAAKGKPKTETAPAPQNDAKPPTGETPVTATIVQPTASSADAHEKRDPAQDKSSQAQVATPTPPAGPAPTAVQTAAAAQTAPAAAATPASDTASSDDDASLLAVLRAANGQPQAPARATDGKSADAPAPSDDFLKDVQIDAKPIADAPKGDTPSRPFGALAPGLGVAAQITAQQTPEQASAADRLAQLAAAAEDKGTDGLTKAADPQKPAENAAPANRIDQPPQIETPAQRQASVNAAAAATAAPNARPVAHPVIAQVAAQVAQAAADGSDRINIRLTPAELGRIDVKLDFGPDGRVQAVFAAERPQTMELLQRDARDLERALQDAGLRADSGSLSFNLRGQGREGQNEANSGGGRGGDAAPAELVVSQVQAYSAGLGGSGRLDIRI